MNGIQILRSAAEATGEEHHGVVARDLESGALVGVACRSEREVYVNSAPARLGYLGQLRIDRRYRGRWWARAAIRVPPGDCTKGNPLPGYLAAVTTDNREASGVLIEKPPEAFPCISPDRAVLHTGCPAGGSTINGIWCRSGDT